MINVAIVSCIVLSVAAIPVLLVGCVMMVIKRIKEKREEKETV